MRSTPAEARTCELGLEDAEADGFAREDRSVTATSRYGVDVIEFRLESTRHAPASVSEEQELQLRADLGPTQTEVLWQIARATIRDEHVNPAIPERDGQICATGAKIPLRAGCTWRQLSEQQEAQQHGRE